MLGGEGARDRGSLLENNSSARSTRRASVILAAAAASNEVGPLSRTAAPDLVKALSDGPPLAACEAAGLQVAVRTWWYGAPDRQRKAKTSSEESWLRSVTVAGLSGTRLGAAGSGRARSELLNAGVPERIVEGGFQLGQWLMHDPAVREAWATCQQDCCSRSAFVARAIDCLLHKFSITAAPPVSVRQLGEIDREETSSENSPSFILTPRAPRAPAGPKPASCRRRPLGAMQPVAEGGLPQCMSGRRSTSPRPPVPTAQEARRSLPPAQEARKSLPPPRPPTAGEMVSRSSGHTPPPLPPLPPEDEWASPEQPLVALRSPPNARVGAVLGKLKRTTILQCIDVEQLSPVSLAASPASPELADLPSLDRGSSRFSSCEIVTSTRGTVELTMPLRMSRASTDGHSMRDHKIFTSDYVWHPASPTGCPVSAISFRLVDKDHEEMVQKAKSLRSPKRDSHTEGPKQTKTNRHSSFSSFESWMHTKGAEEHRLAEANTVVKMEKEIQQVQCKSSFMAVQGKKAGARIVKDIQEVRKFFFQFDEDESGTIEFSEFLPLLAKLMRQPVGCLSPMEVAKKWDELDTDGSGSITWDEFSNWYCATFNVELVVDYRNFISDDLVSDRERLVREVARHLGKDVVQIEKIYIEFSKLDGDGSGSLEYDEFELLMIHALSPRKDSPQVPKAVLQKFWIDVDADGSGSVSFEEFAAWYLKFFCGEISPMEQYYQMIGSGARRASSNSISNAKQNKTTREGHRSTMQGEHESRMEWED